MSRNIPDINDLGEDPNLADDAKAERLAELIADATQDLQIEKEGLEEKLKEATDRIAEFERENEQYKRALVELDSCVTEAQRVVSRFNHRDAFNTARAAGKDEGK